MITLITGSRSKEQIVWRFAPVGYADIMSPADKIPINPPAEYLSGCCCEANIERLHRFRDLLKEENIAELPSQLQQISTRLILTI
jgi:hypothetical protein